MTVPGDDIFSYYMQADEDRKRIVSTLLKGDTPCLYLDNTGIFLQEMNFESVISTVSNLLAFLKKEYGNAFAVFVATLVLSDMPDRSLEEVIRKVQHAKKKNNPKEDGV